MRTYELLYPGAAEDEADGGALLEVVCDLTGVVGFESDNM